MILLDTSGLFAALDGSERHHDSARRILLSSQPRILSPFVLAEIDYIVATRLSQVAELMLLHDVMNGAYRLEPMNAEAVGAARAIIERFEDLGLGLADASIVVLAQQYGCNDILTLDQRHFRAITGLNGEPFRLLPADAGSP